MEQKELPSIEVCSLRQTVNENGQILNNIDFNPDIFPDGDLSKIIEYLDMEIVGNFVNHVLDAVVACVNDQLSLELEDDEEME